MHLEKAKQVANAQQWSGDIRVNFTTLAKAAKRLLRELERLEQEKEAMRPKKKSPF